VVGSGVKYGVKKTKITKSEINNNYNCVQAEVTSLLAELRNAEGKFS